jgi:hypothetical protein
MLKAIDLIQSNCKLPDCENIVVYGIKAQFADEIIQFEDISMKRDDISRLIKIIGKKTLNKTQFGYILEDYVESLYM